MSRCSAFVRHLLTLVLTPASCILSRKGQQSDEPCIQLTYGGLINDQTACLGLFFCKERCNKFCRNDHGNFLTGTNKIMWLNEFGRDGEREKNDPRVLLA